MSVREIISAAEAGPWEVDTRSNYAGQNVLTDDGERRGICTAFYPERQNPTTGDASANATYIATFDPEHVALMEAAIDAAATIGWNERGMIVCGLKAWLSAYNALAAYRAERAL